METVAYNLTGGDTQSCGCLRAEEVTRGLGRTHGLTRTPEHESWRGMKERCLNPAHTSFQHYGGRGITVCGRWINSFETFLADMGHRPEGCSLDRINHDGPYSPDNCRWATLKQQGNNKRANRLMVVNGKTITATEFADTLGVGMWTVGRWLNQGLTPEQMRAKLLPRTHCRNGHALTPDNIYIAYNGRKKCHACVKDAYRRYRPRQTPAA